MNTSGLLSWQAAPAEHLFSVLRQNGAALDASSTGTGKTFVAGAVIREFDFPTLVICPKIAIPAWRRMGIALGVEFDVLNYEKLRTGRTLCGKWNSEDRFEFAPEVKFVVFDEAHRASGVRTQNAEMLIAARRQNIYTLALTATPGDSPMHFRALGYALGLHNLVDEKTAPDRIRPGFWRWARRHGCSPGTWGSFEFRGTEASKRATMAKINADLFPERGARVRVEDLGAAFPAIQITSELYDLGSEQQINDLWQEMAEALEDLKARSANDKEHPMTRLLRARQQLEILKVPALVELSKDALIQGMSVALFVSFSRTLGELQNRLGIRCKIDGTQTGEAGASERQKHIDAFQANQERIIVANVQAGGVSISLHDEHGGHPRIGFVSPGWSATALKQVFGRLHRAGSKSAALYRIVLAAGTIEERVHRAVSRKLDRIDALVDGDLDANAN